MTSSTHNRGQCIPQGQKAPVPYQERKQKGGHGHSGEIMLTYININMAEGTEVSWTHTLKGETRLAV